MPMVNTKEMFKKAYEGGYAIGAFNVNNMEIIQGITEGAKMENAPLILQVSKGARAYAKHVYLMKMIEAAIEDTDLPIVRASGSRPRLRDLQELHRRRLHQRYDRRQPPAPSKRTSP